MVRGRSVVEGVIIYSGSAIGRRTAGCRRGKVIKVIKVIIVSCVSTLRRQMITLGLVSTPGHRG